MKFRFELLKFDKFLNGASSEEREVIEKKIRDFETISSDDIGAYEELCEFMGGQELMVHEGYAYFEVYEYSQGVYVEAGQIL